MDYSQAAQAKALYHSQTAAQNYAVDAATPPEASASEAILSRLANLRMAFKENCSSASHAADKIVGPAPTPINQAGENIKVGNPIAANFMDSIRQALFEMENIGRETQEHLNRIHRAF